MAWLSGALSIAGTLVDAYSKYKQGQDAKEIYEFNEALALYQAQYIEEAGAIELGQLERDVGQYISTQRAIGGKSGIVSDIGSHKDVQDQTRKEGDIDAGIIRWRTSRQAEMARKGADILGTQAGQVSAAGNISAGTTLLGGLSKWDWKKSQLSTKGSSLRIPAGSGYAPSR
jgi:hypothetical protein